MGYDYLGKKTAGELNKLAANLDTRDDALDSDDLMQMINMYLGKLDIELVRTETTDGTGSNGTDLIENNKKYLDENWKYSLLETNSNDNTIILEKYIGENPNVTIKE